MKKSSLLLVLTFCLAMVLLLSLASGEGFQLSDITMENFTISTGPITASGQITLQKVDSQDIWVWEASEMWFENLCLRKVDAQGVLEIRATEARSTGAYLEIAALLPIAENMVGETIDLEEFLEGLAKTENLLVISMHVETLTLYGGTITQITITFHKPDGSPLANTKIYYGTLEGQEVNSLGTTDSQGKITSTNLPLAAQIYLKSADGKYKGSISIGLSGGEKSTTLVEVPPAFPIWAIVAAILIGCCVAGGLVLAKKRGG